MNSLPPPRMPDHGAKSGPAALPNAAAVHAAGLFQIGLRHHQAGNLANAEVSCGQVLAAQPDHPDALHLLGVIAHQRGRHDLAVELIRRAICEHTRAENYHSSLAKELLAQGDCNQAILARRRAALRKSLVAEALSNLGTVLRDQGKLADAVTAYRQAVLIKPHDAEAYAKLGAALRAQGEFHQAVAAHREAILTAPGRAEFHSNLGNALRDQGRLDEAVAAFAHAIKISPACAEFHSNLGNALRDQGKVDEAISAYERAISIDPRHAEFYFNLGVALRYQGNLEAAVATFCQATRCKPVLIDAYSNLGIALLELGRLSECREAWEEAVRLAPGDTRCLHNLGEVVRFAADDPRLAAMEEMAANSASLPSESRVHLHFALAKAYADVGRHADAFHQWLDGNALKRRQVDYCESTMLGTMDRARAVFTPQLLQRFQDKGSPSRLPIFIVGVPRSGTTLVEQILASHPDVFGGGELNYFGAAVNAIRRDRTASRPYPDLPLDMASRDFGELGERYVAAIRSLAPAAMRITDKMPGNFIFLGLIHLALPNAVIIHTRRDPLDTCVSCFSKLFVEEQNHTYDLAELGRYYRSYQELMAHWNRVLPAGRILDVQYEDVVGDLEGQARRIIAHCGLAWDARCLAFHQTERTVRTFSAAQVRQPIYSHSVGRWRPYAAFLEPLFAGLGWRTQAPATAE